MGNVENISEEIKKRIEDISKKNYLTDVVADLNKYLFNIPGIDIKARVKSVESALEKIERKGYQSINQLTDLAGIMIITKSESDIYKVRDILVSKYSLLEENNYIIQPKHGYKSLHLNLSINSITVEIQIKTYDMKRAQTFSHKYIYKNKYIPDVLKPVLGKMVFPVLSHIEKSKQKEIKKEGSREVMEAQTKGISDDLIRMARSTDLESYCRSKGYKMEKEGNQYRLPGHGGLIINGKMWYWQTKGIGGNAIDFLVKVEGKSFNEAIKELTGRVGDREQVKVHPTVIEKSRTGSIELPEFSKDMKRAFSYLIITRGLNKTIVSDLVNLKSIKESIEYHVKDNVMSKLIDEGKIKAEDSKNQKVIKQLITDGVIKEYNTMHNVCFLGRDKEGNIQYGMERSTLSNSSFKRDLPGANKSYSFCIEGKSDRLILCESPIEVMSVATIERLYEKNYKKDHKLSAGGVSDRALEQYLKDHPEIKKITIAFNKDPDFIDGVRNKAKENVETAVKAIYEKYGHVYEIDRIEPNIGIDWNDVIKKIDKDKIVKDKPDECMGKMLGEYKRVEVYDRKRDMS